MYILQISPKSCSHPIQVLPQAHLHSSLTIFPTSSPFQIRNCGMSSYRTQNELDSHILTEYQPWEWHVSQKQQERFWGVVPIPQSSQEAT